MAVSPLPQTRTAGIVHAGRTTLLVDLVLGVLTVVTLPLAVVVIPNTISVVAALLPPEVSPESMMRAHGLALPAMLLTVPFAAMVVRRLPAATMLVAGLALLALADLLGGYAGSVGWVGALRVLHGIAAGMLVPATLAAVVERPRSSVLLPLWVAMLAISLMSAQALALWPLDKVDSWQVTLQPYPLLTGIALAVAGVYLILWLLDDSGYRAGRRDRGGVVTVRMDGADSESRPRSLGAVTAPGAEHDASQGTERLPATEPVTAAKRSPMTGLVLASVLAAGVAVLGIGTSFGWPPVSVMVAAAAAVAAMLVLGAIGTIPGSGGRAIAFTSVAVGLVVLPTAAQTTYVELGGLGGPGLKGLWLPFALAALITIALAIAVGRVSEAKASTFTSAGLVAMVAGLCAVRLMVPLADGLPLVVPMVLLAGGSAVAVVAALRRTPVETALFGVSLCMSAVLAGFLLGTEIQVHRLREINELADQAIVNSIVDSFVAALHTWALVAGFAVVVIILLSALLTRRPADALSGTASMPQQSDSAPDGQVKVPAPTVSPEGNDGVTGEPDSDR